MDDIGNLSCDPDHMMKNDQDVDEWLLNGVTGENSKFPNKNS